MKLQGAEVSCPGQEASLPGLGPVPELLSLFKSAGAWGP